MLDLEEPPWPSRLDDALAVVAEFELELDFDLDLRPDPEPLHCFECETDIRPDDWDEHECGIP